MYRILFFILITATTLPAFSQHAVGDSIILLKVFNEKKGVYILLEEGEFISYKTKSQTTKKAEKGQLNAILINDSLLIGEEMIAINQLEMLMSITHKQAIKSKNVSLAIAGGIAFIAGSALLTLNQSEAKIIGVVGLIAGVSTLIIAIIPLTHSNHYSLKKGWKYTVIKTVIEDEEFIYQHY